MEQNGLTQEQYDSLRTYSNPRAIYEALRKHIKGQDAALKKLSLVSAQRDAAIIEELEGGMSFTGRVKHSSLLLSGNSGCGKTYMVRKLGEILDVHVEVIDLSQFTGAGWKGKQLDEAIESVRHVSSGRGFKGIRTIVFIDEIDKVLPDASPKGEHKIELINELLVTIDKYGTTELPNSILWIFAGSFNVYRDRKAKQNQKGGIGFGSKMKEVTTDINYLMNRQDYLNAGLSLEFLGRVTHTVTLNAVGKKELREILDSEEGSPLIDLYDLAYHMDVQLDLTDEKRDKIVDEAFKLGTGVRGLRTAAELILFDEVL